MKKLIIALLICLLLASLIACDDASDTPDTTIPPETTAPAGDAAASPAEDFIFEENKDGSYTLIKYIGHERDVIVPSMIDGKNVSAIGEKAFSESGIIRQNSLISVTLPSTVKTVGDFAFEKCKTLTTIVLPEGIVSIGHFAFSECISLSDITLPSTLCDLGTGAFNYCNSLTSINIPESLTKIPSGVFTYTRLESVTLHNKIESIGSSAFWAVKIKEIEIPASVKEIGGNAFAYCTELTTVKLNEGLEKIGNGAFEGDDKLTELTVPASVTEMHEDSISYTTKTLTFLGKIPDRFIIEGAELPLSAHDLTIICKSDAGATFPRWNGYKTQLFGTTSRDAKIFEDFEYEENGNGGITITEYIGDDENVSVPSSIDNKPVTEIGTCAFLAKKVSSVTLPDTVKVISDRAFASSALTTVNTPRDLTAIGNYAFLACSKLTAFELTDSITSIGAYAFNNCRSIEKIKIPSSLKTVSEYAFSFTLPKSFEISEGIEVIEKGAFCGVKIDNIILPSTVKSIGDKAFYQSYANSVTLNDRLEEIGDNAFESGSFTEITIPASVKRINETAFNNCNKLKEVTFEGDAPENYLTDAYTENDQGKIDYTVRYKNNAKGFTSPTWNTYKSAPLT